jgi:hypothetical protein
MKECPESLISASLLRQVIARLVVEMHYIHGILLAVIHDLPIGVNLQRIHLEALRLIGSTTMRWRGLGGGLILISARSWFLGLGRGTTRGSTNIVMMLQTMLLTTSHCLQERIKNTSEYKA